MWIYYSGEEKVSFLSAFNLGHLGHSTLINIDKNLAHANNEEFMRLECPVGRMTTVLALGLNR